MNAKFEKGQAYLASPTIQSDERKIVVCNGREGGVVTFALVNDVYNVRVLSYDGREFAMIKGEDGLDYTTSATVPIDIKNAGTVLRVIRGR